MLLSYICEAKEVKVKVREEGGSEKAKDAPSSSLGTLLSCQWRTECG